MEQHTMYFLVKLVVLLMYIIIAVSVEQDYREPLFVKSLTLEKEWQENSSSWINFFKVITEFGSEKAFIPLILVIHLCFPLIKSYAFLITMIYSVYIDNLLKVIYGNPRPYWIDSNLKQACDGGFGNPSGHSFSSTAVYIALWHILTDFQLFKETIWGIILKFSILVFFLLLIIAIATSRLYLGIHSVNQILYGGTLGLGLYLLIFQVFALLKFNAKEFFNLFSDKTHNIIFAIGYFLLFLIGFLTWGLLSFDTKDWESSLNKSCPELKQYRLFNNDALYGMFTLFAIIGAHYGLVFMINLSLKKFPKKEEEINCWIKGDCPNQLYRVLLFFVFVLPVILLFAIPSESSLEIVLIFKVSLPYLLTVFNIFGPLIYCSFLLKIGNDEVTQEKKTLMIIPQRDIEMQTLKNNNDNNYNNNNNNNDNNKQ